MAVYARLYTGCISCMEHMQIPSLLLHNCAHSPAATAFAAGNYGTHAAGSWTTKLKRSTSRGLSIMIHWRGRGGTEGGEEVRGRARGGVGRRGGEDSRDGEGGMAG